MPYGPYDLERTLLFTLSFEIMNFQLPEKTSSLCVITTASVRGSPSSRTVKVLWNGCRRRCKNGRQAAAAAVVVGTLTSET